MVRSGSGLFSENNARTPGSWLSRKMLIASPLTLLFLFIPILHPPSPFPLSSTTPSPLSVLSPLVPSSCRCLYGAINLRLRQRRGRPVYIACARSAIRKGMRTRALVLPRFFFRCPMVPQTSFILRRQNRLIFFFPLPISPFFSFSPCVGSLRRRAS